MMAQYGTDALRYALAVGGTPGNDIKLDPQRIEDGRNFITKIWNAARYVLAQRLESAPPGPARPLSLADRWLASRLARVVADVTRLIDGYQFGEAGRQAHDFLWNEYCDWYVEIAKIQLQGSEEEQGVTRGLLRDALETSLRLLHPYIPFVTEEIWQQLPHQGEALIVAPWPRPGTRDEDAEREMEIIFSLIRFVRNARAELGLDPVRRLPLIVVGGERSALMHAQTPIISALARVELELHEQLDYAPAQALHAALPGVTLYLPLEGVIDLDVERERLRKEIAAAEKVGTGLRARLTNAQFLERAPADVVQKERDRLTESEELVTALNGRLEVLGG
jgi:valyl-tRNA synthetase